MIEYLESIDIEAFKALNGIHNVFFDEFMWLVSGKFAWLLMCATLLYITFKKDWRSGLIVVILLSLTIALSDQMASGVIKHTVERLRPTRTESLIPIVHTVKGYIGGMYGFVSSHAANSFGAAILLSLLFKNKSFGVAIFCWAALLSYSRIYLGVHFPGDILGGAVVGLLMGYLVYKIYVWVCNSKYRVYVNMGKYDSKKINLLTYSICVNMCILLVISATICFLS